MNIRKYFTSRFFIILLILLPAICTDSLLTNELSGTVHFQTIAPFFLQTENDISANKLYANATSTDNTTANDEQGGVLYPEQMIILCIIMNLSARQTR